MAIKERDGCTNFLTFVGRWSQLIYVADALSPSEIAPLATLKIRPEYRKGVTEQAKTQMRERDNNNNNIHKFISLK